MFKYSSLNMIIIFGVANRDTGFILLWCVCFLVSLKQRVTNWVVLLSHSFGGQSTR